VIKWAPEPVPPVAMTFSGLRLMMREGKIKMGASLIPVAKGYNLLLQQHLSANVFLLNSERSKKPRVFKTVEAALIACKELGIPELRIGVH